MKKKEMRKIISALNYENFQLRNKLRIKLEACKASPDDFLDVEAIDGYFASQGGQVISYDDEDGDLNELLKTSSAYQSNPSNPMPRRKFRDSIVQWWFDIMSLFKY